MKFGILTFRTLKARDAEELNFDVLRDMGFSPSERRGLGGGGVFDILDF